SEFWRIPLWDERSFGRRSEGPRRPERRSDNLTCAASGGPARIAVVDPRVPARQVRMPMSAPQRRRADAPQSPARMRKADRKRQLLAHAKQLFVTLGYQDTTTEKIARAAGVSEPVLYRHFENKKALFLEVLQEIRAATLTRWQAETAAPSDPLAKLHRIADLYLDTTRDHALELRVMHRSLMESDDEEI